MRPKRTASKKETEKVPQPGEPGYMAYVADVSASLGSLARAYLWLDNQKGGKE